MLWMRQIWCFVIGNLSLPGAHSAIVDAKARCTIVADEHFWHFIDKPVSMISMADVWASKIKKRNMRDSKLKRKVPSGWTEGETGSAWQLPGAKTYFVGGGHYGPSLATKEEFYFHLKNVVERQKSHGIRPGVIPQLCFLKV
jgi:hypothetical protein